ncbi:MAG TPA: class I adenylate-forming enzyme family protein [Steroidobacteraceae bacterium]|jgi:fatty-acyl-CoA synthase/long-chain acyl-CoA synthetase
MISDNKRFNLGYLPHRAFLGHPDSVAVIDLAAGAAGVITYRELERRLERFAAAVSMLGLEPGSRVALLIGNRSEYLIALYGSLRAGLCPVMVNTRLGLKGLQESLEEIEAQVAIVDPACNESGLEAARDVPHRIILGGIQSGWQEFAEFLESATDSFEPPTFSSLSAAELCFTSGSTGRPKAVVLSHRGTLLKLHLYANEHRAMRGESLCALIHLPIFHANARLSAGVAFETGGRVVIQQRFDPRQTLENIAKYRVNYFLNVAPAYVAMLQQEDLLQSLDLSSLRFPLVGSAPSGGDMLKRAEAAMRVRIMHTYGSTEAGTVLQHRLDDDAPLSSCGRPLSGNEIKLIDPVTGLSGNAGELWIRNEWLALGYWRRPAETAAKFVDGWYRSGDLFERDSRGHFYFRGRVDDMFNVGGEKVYPAEVEGLLQRHPMVQAASVVPVAHDSKGEVPVAMVISVRPNSVSAQELKDFCLAHGPAYAHPRAILFVDAFPLAATGKIDRNQVRAAVLAAMQVK